MSAITTHVLDTSLGQPARGIEVFLSQRDSGGEWRELGSGITDADGRVGDLLRDDHRLAVAVYRLRFVVAPYGDRGDEASFFPWIDLVFQISEPTEHYHVPILLSLYGFTTYRGS